MDTLQTKWDAALIKTWRLDGRLQDTINLFNFLNGNITFSFDLNLKRIPAGGFPWTVHVRVFMDQFLPKINERLWSQSPEKDVLLLRKLATSNYDTYNKPIRNSLLASTQVGHKIRKSKSIMEYEFRNWANRNNKTDWNKVKSNKVKR